MRTLLTLGAIVASAYAFGQCQYAVNLPERLVTACTPKFKGGHQFTIQFVKEGDRYSTIIEPPVASMALLVDEEPRLIYPATLDRSVLEEVNASTIDGAVFELNGEKLTKGISYNESVGILEAIQCLLRAGPRQPGAAAPLPSDTMLLGILPLVDGRVTYDAVVPVDTVPASDLYKRARRWVVDAYRSANAVIQYDSPADGEVIGKGAFPIVWMVTFYFGQDVNIQHTVKLRVKNGRYRYTFTDFRAKYYVKATQYNSGNDFDVTLEEWRNTTGSNTQKLYHTIDETIKSTIEQLRSYMAKPLDDDW